MLSYLKQMLPIFLAVAVIIVIKELCVQETINGVPVKKKFGLPEKDKKD